MGLKTEVEFGIKRIGNVNFLKIKVQCGLKVSKQTKMIKFKKQNFQKPCNFRNIP